MKPIENVQDVAASVSRRSLFRSVAIGTGGMALLLGGTSPPAQAKMTQKAVGYQNSPKGDQSCSNCNLFRAPDACMLVEGPINPQGWCRYHQTKT